MSKYLYDIPEYIIRALERYQSDGLSTGGFLYAVLSNNLMEAVARADADNKRALPEICSYVYNEMPYSSHGSPEKVDAWIQSFAESRAKSDAEKKVG